MEDELHRQYTELHKKGLKVKSWWFEARCNDLMKVMHPEVQFKFQMGGSLLLRREKELVTAQRLMCLRKHPAISKAGYKSFIGTFDNLLSEEYKEVSLDSTNSETLAMLIKHLCLSLLIMVRGMMTGEQALSGIVVVHWALKKGSALCN